MLAPDLPSGALVAKAMRLLGGPGRGHVLGYYPISRTNPYQALLYRRAHEAGFAPVGLVKGSDLVALDVAVRYGTPAVFHLHWTSPVLERAETDEDAEQRAEGFLDQLSDLKARGVRLLWTVHNVLPHACRFPGVEARMRQRIVDLADVVHTMSPTTVSDTSAHYSLPEHKLIEVPHPSYRGVYPQFFDRVYSRFEMGFEPTDVVIGVVGSIQPYKGLDEFVDAAANAIADNPRLRAMVAGMPGRDEASRQLVAELARQSHIQLLARKLDPTGLAMVVRSLDAAVLPYRASLNSGAAILALTFGLPIVAPLIGHFRHLIESGMGLGYDPDDPVGLRTSLVSVAEFVSKFDPEIALRFAEETSSEVVSEDFFAALGRALGRNPSGETAPTLVGLT